MLSFNTISGVVSGVQARTVSHDEPTTLPRRRITSEGQYQNGPEDEPSPDVPVRSPVRCVSPEFVNAIAMNPGGRPKEVKKLTFSNMFFHFSSFHIEMCLVFCIFSRDTCTATVRPSRRWTAA